VAKKMKDAQQPERVSIKTISEITGYSVATVSRVLNNKGRCSAEAERKIRKAAKEYNYLPNLLAKGLRTNQIPTVGIIVPDITNEYFSRITLAAQNALFRNHYSAFICNTNEKRELEDRHLTMLASQNIGGIIFVCCEQRYQGNFYSKIPTVYVDRSPKVQAAEEDDFVLIQGDNYEGGRMVVRELAEAGCKRILSIFDIRDVSPKIDRLNGVLDEMNARGLESGRIHYAPEMNYMQFYSIMNGILDRGLDFDGVFCYNDIGALGAIKAFANRGINVPRGVKLIGFDGISHTEYNSPSISTIQQPMEEMGEMAANIILKLMNGEAVEQKKYILPVTLVKRQTTSAG